LFRPGDGPVGAKDKQMPWLAIGFGVVPWPTRVTPSLTAAFLFEEHSMKNGNGEWRAKKAIRLNIGLTEKEWAVLHKGLAIMHPCGQPRVDPLESVSSHQRNRIWALALLAVFKAVIRQGCPWLATCARRLMRKWRNA